MQRSILHVLPPEYPDAQLEPKVRAAIARTGTQVVALDDDPTGVQTVHGIAVLTRWNAGDLAAELSEPGAGFFVLTNSRSLAPDDAVALARELSSNLVQAAAETSTRFVIASRSDSTLRGHFPGETDALAASLGRVDAVLLCPAFIEGGRLTIDDIHYLAEGDRLVPVSETEFARDDAFGYQHANLREWIEEKSGGKVRASDVQSLTLNDIRVGGPEHVLAQLMRASGGRYIVVNAASYQDLAVVVLGVVRAEEAGKRFMYRCGASFVRARLGLSARPLLTRTDLFGESSAADATGMVVVGSHVGRTRRQLRQLLDLPNIAPIEVPVPELLAGPIFRQRVIDDTVRRGDAALKQAITPVIYTSAREQRGIGGQAGLAESRQVSASLVDIVRAISGRPAYILAKGGITSSDIGTKALGVRRAQVQGQILPGVPVWRLGPESRHPELPYIIFPGNVGTDESLAQLVTQLERQPNG